MKQITITLDEDIVTTVAVAMNCFALLLANTLVVKGEEPMANDWFRDVDEAKSFFEGVTNG